MSTNQSSYSIGDASYVFAPAPTITAYQLALCTSFMLYCTHAQTIPGGAAGMIARWDELGECQRHFTQLVPATEQLESEPAGSPGLPNEFHGGQGG